MTPDRECAVATPLLHRCGGRATGGSRSPEKKGRSPNLRKKGFVSGSPHPEGWARHSTTLKHGVSQHSPARGGRRWQVPLPESVAVWPATGMNCHAYVPSPRVSLSTPYTLLIRA